MKTCGMILLGFVAITGLCAVLLVSVLLAVAPPNPWWAKLAGGFAFLSIARAGFTGDAKGARPVLAAQELAPTNLSARLIL